MENVSLTILLRKISNLFSKVIQNKLGKPPPQTPLPIYLFTLMMLMLNIYRTTLSRRSDSIVSGHEKMTVTKNLSDIVMLRLSIENLNRNYLK